MKLYQGYADTGRVLVEESDDDDDTCPPQIRDLDLRLDLRNHSPTGFAWGYGGSGPAQLALALVANATGDDELALRVYQRLKDHVISRLGQDNNFILMGPHIEEWAREFDK